MFPSHVMGTFGTNRIYLVGRVVKVADYMRSPGVGWIPLYGSPCQATTPGLHGQVNASTQTRIQGQETVMNFALRYGGNRTHAGANPDLIRSATLTIQPTEYIRLVPNVPITCGFGSLRISMQNSSQFLVPGGEFAWEHLPVHVVQES